MDSANQTAVICGPALGGLVYALRPVLIGVICLIFFSCSITLVTLAAPTRDPPTFASVLAGFHYIRTRRRLLGVITLDLFVVILGGPLPCCRFMPGISWRWGRSVSACFDRRPAVGALITSIVLARYPVERHIGRKMFAVVGLYGVTTIIFGLSTSFPVSLAALAVLGASDAVSIVIRFSLVQVETPDEKRGRVSAINYLFVGSSNALGEFESGLVAAWLGAVPSVAIGGPGSLLVASLWMMLFPDLHRIDRYEPADREHVRA